MSVALGDLDGVHGKDIVVALWQPGAVGVMLNHGDGTFGALQQYSAGPQCAGLAVEVELGDVTGPAGAFVPDGKLDAYVACTPYVVRLAGDGAGALGNPIAFQLYLPQYIGSATIDFLTLVRRQDGNPAPLLAFQHSVGSFGRQLCISYELDAEALVCSPTPVQGPLAVGDINGAFPGVPPDEIVTGLGGDKLGIFGFAHAIPTYLSNSVRTVASGVESAAFGDLDGDGRLDVLVGQSINSANARVDSIHSFLMGASELEQVARTLPSTPGLDAVAIADVDGDGRTDVVGAGGYGRGMIHRGLGAGNFDTGRDLPQLGYQNAATATHVTMAVGDLTGDGRPELVIADQLGHTVMVYCNASAPAGACRPPEARDDVAVLAENAGATAIDVLANDTDPDGDAMLVVSVSQPAHGSVAIAAAGVTYRPAADYCNDLGGAPDTFTYTLNGGSTATVAVTVQCVAEFPPEIGTRPAPPTPAPPPPPPTVPRTCSNPGTKAFTVGTPSADVLVGTTGRDVLSGRGGDDCLFGLAGDDRISGGTGADRIKGSSGNDRLHGDAGDDDIDGWNGNDTITPGAGKDKVSAGGGNDTVSARDGARDTIDCGGGRDKVTADRTDAVKNCEYVKRAVRSRR
jgi:Ca2+-binding RTX toxin-like protein